MAFDGGKHVMLSYNHKSKDIVKQIKEELEKKGIPVWFDERDMEDNMFDSMPKAVGDSFVVCCFMTQGYEESRNCKLELEHAQRRKKRIIPCMMSSRKVWKSSPDGWLDFITGSLIGIDFSDTSDKNVSANVNKLIDRINQKSSDPTPPSVSKTSDFFQSIKHEYLRNSRIHRMMNEEQSFSIEQSYINLAIVTTEEQCEKEDKLRLTEHSRGIIGTFEDIYDTKTSIDVKEIFEKCKDQTKKVLVLGRAGIGKSTFCRYVTYQWAKCELWTEYQLVILIRLRLLTDTRYPSGRKYSLIDLVEKEYFPCDTISAEYERRFKQLCDKGQVLWLLDGYDEFVQNTPKHLNDVFNHIRKTQHHILTSRPYSIALSYEVRMEITGFTDKNIEKYIEQFFDQIKDQPTNVKSESRKLLNLLKSNPNIWGVAHIPINLEMICSLWSDSSKSQATALTMTKLYDNMIEWLCRRYLIKQKNLSRNKVDGMFEHDIYEQCKKELIFLENLAFNAMETNTLILHHSSYEKALKDANTTIWDTPHILNTGILKSFHSNSIGNQGQTKRDYYFVHLSFQEHFAARYLVNTLTSQSSEKAIEFIQNNKYNQRFTLVFSFACGLLSEQNLKLPLTTFWSTLLSEPLDLVGLRHIQLIIYCIEEMTDKSYIPRYLELIDNITKWINYIASSHHKIISYQLTSSFERSTSLVKEPAIIYQFTNLLKSPNSEIGHTTLTLIKAFSTYNLHPHLLHLLTLALQNQNWNVRKNACDALRQMAEEAATSEVISKLVSALGDENQYVRSNACIALGDMGEKAATSEMISKLVSALGDENQYVRSNACVALVKMGEKAATSEAISKLVSSLGVENEYVRRSACAALVKMGKEAATSEMISKLVSALGDENEYVRSNVCLVLSEMGEKAATSEVISKLVSALADENWNVRSNACVALGDMSEKAATSEVISKLGSALADENEYVRSNACLVLSEMGEKAATSEVISKLVSALADENWNVRSSACVALVKMSEKATTSEMISKLVSALGDENEYVRSNVCLVLSEMGEKAATSEAISKLVSTLADENWNVRSNVCVALGDMGEKAATSEVISKLGSALTDENEYVRRSACTTLGKIGEKAATSEVISKLVSAFGDENDYVRRSARDALGEMGEKAASSEVISKLVSALEDENEFVRMNARDALGEMGEKAASNEVISKLMSALGDENWNVRVSACRAFGKMGEKAASNEVISKLVSVLGDENDDVRYNACYALGEMGEKAATSEVISELVSVLGDENDDVRYNACHALSKMGEKAATSKVINKLVSALGDDNWSVRATACDALGKMVEKVATDEIVMKLLERLEDNQRNVQGAAEKALKSILCVFSVMVGLDRDTVLKLLDYVKRKSLNKVSFIPPVMLIKLFLHTKSSVWLSVASLVTFLHGSGVTILEDAVVIYSNKEPVRLDESNRERLDELANAFRAQAVRFGLACAPARESQVSIDQKENLTLRCEKASKISEKADIRSSICCLS